MIINTAFGISEIILPTNVPFFIKGENRLGETLFLSNQQSFRSKFNYSSIPRINNGTAPITILSNCVMGKSFIRVFTYKQLYLLQK
jgi:hypothetical protein